MEHTMALTQKAGRLRWQHPLGAVMAWELRRLAAHRGLWLLAGGLFVVFTALFPLVHALVYGSFTSQDTFDIFLPGAGLAVLVGGFEALKVAFIVLCAGLLAGDVQRRTHELLMATAVPTWAYIWGRWLAGLVLSGALSLLLLGGVLAGSWIVHLPDPGHSISPNMGAILSVWAFLAAVDVPLVSALALVGGACWPRRTMAVPVSLAALCIAGPQITLGMVTPSGGPVRVPTWVPNHLFMIGNVIGEYNNRLEAQLTPYVQAPDPDINIIVQIWRNVWAGPVNLAPWLPQLAYAGLSVVLVALLAWRFRRFPA